MQVRPAIVDLDAKHTVSRIKGRYLRGEHAVFLHDFTTSGFTPLQCVAELQGSGVVVQRIVSFLVREETFDELRAHCAKAGVDLQVFCLERRSGDLTILG
jgi:orotate phosphoribosyltransferase